MAVTGVFQADFSNFDKAVTASQGKLLAFEGSAGKVESSLRLMTQSQEQLLDKIGASGGKIQDLGATAGETAGEVNTLSQSYRQFDGLLQSAGINIGPQVKGLEDLASAAGKGATELGLLGTAGAVVGTAMAAWKLGTWIGEITGATQAIEDLTAAYMGLGNLAGETAGAKQDTINRAIAQGAKETISYTEAIKFNQAAMQQHTDASINWREKLGAAHSEVRKLTEAQKEEIAIAIEAGAKTEQLTAKYGISAQGLEILAGKQKEASAAAAQHTRELEAQAAALEKAYAKLMSDVKNANQLAIMEKDAADATAAAFNRKAEAGAGFMRAVEGQAKQTREATEAAAAYVTEQEALTAANDATWQSLDQTAEAHTAAGDAAVEGTAQTIAGYQGVAQQVEITSDGVRGWLELMRRTNEANALLSQNSLWTSGSTLENQSRLGTAFSPIPGFAGGIENFGGGLARVHGGEVLANLPKGTSVIPKGGLGANISNVFNLVDSESNLARRVADLIMRQVRAGTQLGQA